MNEVYKHNNQANGVYYLVLVSYVVCKLSQLSTKGVRRRVYYDLKLAMYLYVTLLD